MRRKDLTPFRIVSASMMIEAFRRSGIALLGYGFFSHLERRHAGGNLQMSALEREKAFAVDAVV
ncbi:hypothetical protein [Hyphomicrobium sulfonivorans]|uniref:hypothetical protein n=1 Tax=Hyphomicrobium sulfonivorans TaxID=121290 RepID=UPI00156F3152|nr:hypothetical protein [Hyphomicrobium sulfonivorans]MBI1648611.1 hypothetical protein [Hyphomicrobium sulfonivorans]